MRVVVHLEIKERHINRVIQKERSVRVCVYVCVCVCVLEREREREIAILI